MNPFRRHLSYANVTATLALVFAMSGGALAAKHYLVNSTNQINPKVLKKLRGNAGPRGATGAQGALGQIGAQGLAGAPGKEGSEGREGKRGPSDVYEVQFTKSSGYKQTCSMTLSNLPPGAYAVFGKADLIPGERKSGPARCELRASSDFDLAFSNFVSPGFGFEGVLLTTELTHTFESTGAVTMTCEFETALPSTFSSNPAARIVAIKVDSEHRTTTEAG